MSSFYLVKNFTAYILSLMKSIISFASVFGISDGSVGIVNGVINSIDPELKINDYSFKPLPNFGSKNPKHNGVICFGKNLSKVPRPEKIELKSNVDKSLIGGFVLRVGSTMIDSSIKTKLNSLKMIMKGV